MANPEETAALENEAIEAMGVLVAEHGYTRDDLEPLLDAAEENGS